MIIIFWQNVLFFLTCIAPLYVLHRSQLGKFDSNPPPLLNQEIPPSGGGQGYSFWTRMETYALNCMWESTVKSQYPRPMVRIQAFVQRADTGVNC